MIKKDIAQKLNEQFKKEYFSHYLYLAMAAHCTSQGFDGAAHWMRLQSQEELAHALKIFDYLTDQQEKPVLAAIDAPGADFGSLEDIFGKALGHEQLITRSIHELFRSAREQGDFATEAFLQWYVNEQVEEEKEAQRIVDRIKMAAGSKGALLYIDKELGKRE